MGELTMDYEICPECAYVLEYGETDTGNTEDDTRRAALCEPWDERGWSAGYEEQWGGCWCHICGDYSDNYYIMER